MSATIIYAALLMVLMSLINGCARTEGEPKPSRVVCRSAPAAKRAAPLSPPRSRL